MVPPSKPSIASQIVELVRYVIDVETMPWSGRLNFGGMLLFILATGLCGLLGFLEPLIRIWQPDYRSGIDVIQLLLLFVLFVAVCVLMTGLLFETRYPDGWRNRRDPPEHN